MSKPVVKFGEWIEKGFNLYKDNFAVLVLAALLAVVLSSITIGIMAGPMMAGMALIALNLLDKKEPKAEVGDVFKGFNYFLPAFLFCLLLGLAILVVFFILSIIPCIGQLASIFVAFAVEALVGFVFFLIVDKKLDFWPATMASVNVVKQNFWPFLGFFAVTAIIGQAGGVLCGIGVILTLPMMVCMQAVAYREVFADQPVDVTAEPVSPVPEMPPTANA